MTDFRQQFKQVDVLRLEVAPEQTGLVNLIENPSGASGSASGWVTPLANTVITAVAGPLLRFAQTTATNTYFLTEALPVVAGRYAGFSFNLTGGTASKTVTVAFEWVDSSGTLLSTSTASPVWSTSAGTVSFGPVQVPAGATSARVRVSFSTGASGSFFTFKEATFATSANSADIGVTRTNYATNPSVETNLTGWTGTAATLSRVNASQIVGNWILGITCTDNVQALARMTGPGGAVAFPGRTYTVSAYVRANTTTRQMRIGANGTGFSTHSAWLSITSAWTRISHTFTIPVGATNGFNVDIGILGQTGLVFYADAVLVEESATVGDYFDATTPDTGSIQYDASGPFSIAQTTYLGYVQPLQYVNIISPAHSIKVHREGLDVGTLTATILDSTLDPATASTIRPGRKCRLLVKTTDTLAGVPATRWEPLFTGKLKDADVQYDLKAPTASKVSRITILAIDNIAALANAQRPQGVVYMTDLPYVLEGAGVPWNVNGSGNQVGSATVVSDNDNATALDQVAITRDTNHGYAWVDRFNVLNAWTLAAMPTGSVTIDEDDYSDLDVSFSARDVINEVKVKNIEWDPTDPTRSIEVAYGPYRDQPSIDEWGPYSKEFTIQGVNPAIIGDFAATVLAKNKTPGVRINSVRLPILTTTHLMTSALLDLYQLATVTNTAKSLSNSVRVTAIEHTITSDGWLMDLTFSKPSGVASPQLTPPVQSSGGEGAADTAGPTAFKPNDAAVPANVRLITKTATVTAATNAGGLAVITYPTPFPTGVVSVLLTVDAANDAAYARLDQTAAPVGTSFAIQIFKPNGTVLASSIVRVSYLATGW